MVPYIIAAVISYAIGSIMSSVIISRKMAVSTEFIGKRQEIRHYAHLRN